MLFDQNKVGLHYQKSSLVDKMLAIRDYKGVDQLYLKLRETEIGSVFASPIKVRY